MKYIKFIGLEVEGGWIVKPKDSKIHFDGSVKFAGKKAKDLLVGEISSAPLAAENMESVEQWILTNWPHRRNKTCGFHIHVSFLQESDYRLLMTKAFYNVFLDSAMQFAREHRLSKAFYSRLQGHNRYCQRTFRAKVQYARTNKAPCRYTHLNYCYSLRGTIENRLPTTQMTKEKAFNTILWFINTIEKYLDNLHKNNSMKEQTAKELVFEVANR